MTLSVCLPKNLRFEKWQDTSSNPEGLRFTRRSHDPDRRDAITPLVEDDRFTFASGISESVSKKSPKDLRIHRSQPRWYEPKEEPSPEQPLQQVFLPRGIDKSERLITPNSKYGTGPVGMVTFMTANKARLTPNAIRERDNSKL